MCPCCQSPPSPAEHLHRSAPVPLLLFDDVPELATIDLTAPAAPDGQPVGRLRRARQRLGDVALVAVLVLAVLVAAQISERGGRPPTAAAAVAMTGPSPTAAPAAAPEQWHPAIAAPAVVRAGERMDLLGYRQRGLCGDLTLLLDDVPVPVDIAATVTAPDPSWDGVVLTILVPTDLAAGDHGVELSGPVRVLGQGAKCGNDARQPYGLIGRTTITVEAP